MLPYLTTAYGNPSAIHAEGRAAKAAITEARRTTATILGVRPENIIFTSGGTEANALALMGYVDALHSAGRSWETMEVISTAIEHPSILRTLIRLRERGVVVRTVAVSDTGRISPEALTALLTPQTVLVTCAYVNSEIGTIQPVHALARALRAYARAAGVERIPLHIDAAQAPLWLTCVLPQLDVDMLSLDGAKCGGPKGSGVLAVRKPFSVQSIFDGGGQEAGHRPGTENVAGIVGMATALALAQKGIVDRAEKVRALRDAALAKIEKALPAAIVNGSKGSERVANNINVSIPGLDTEYATVVLDTAGIAVSTKSACAGAGGGVSVVVEAISGDTARARSTLRLTLGEDTTEADLEAAIAVLAAHVQQMARLTK